MPQVNPKNLSWIAPTTNTDGSPITNPLDYELGVRRAEDAAPQAYMSVVGSLQEGGDYNAPLDKTGLQTGVPLFLSLRAINRMDPSNPMDDLTSAWSNEVEILLSNGIPEAPTNFTVA